MQIQAERTLFVAVVTGLLLFDAGCLSAPRSSPTGDSGLRERPVRDAPETPPQVAQENRLPEGSGVEARIVDDLKSAAPRRDSESPAQAGEESEDLDVLFRQMTRPGDDTASTQIFGVESFEPEPERPPVWLKELRDRDPFADDLLRRRKSMSNPLLGSGSFGIGLGFGSVTDPEVNGSPWGRNGSHGLGGWSET